MNRIHRLSLLIVVAIGGCAPNLNFVRSSKMEDARSLERVEVAHIPSWSVEIAAEEDEERPSNQSDSEESTRLDVPRSAIAAAAATANAKALVGANARAPPIESKKPSAAEPKVHDAEIKHQALPTAVRRAGVISAIPTALNGRPAIRPEDELAEMESISRAMVVASKNEFRRDRGVCACPDDLDLLGRACGQESGYFGPKVHRPLCYVSDVTPDMIVDFMRTGSIMFSIR